VRQQGQGPLRIRDLCKPAIQCCSRCTVRNSSDHSSRRMAHSRSVHKAPRNSARREPHSTERDNRRHGHVRHIHNTVDVDDDPRPRPLPPQEPSPPETTERSVFSPSMSLLEVGLDAPCVPAVTLDRHRLGRESPRAPDAAWASMIRRLKTHESAEHTFAA
jgi:hypothetical protein